MYERFKYQIWLHVAILIFGTTGILGRLITVDAFHTVWHRLWIAVGSMSLALFVIRHGIAVNRERLFKILGTGAILAAHWVTFFEAINRSNVSAALVCLSSTAFFTSILEPIYYKRGIAWREPVFGLCIIVGLYFVFQSELHYATGMIFGIISAIFAAWFTVINGLLVRRTDAKTITFYELVGAFLALSVFMLVTGAFDSEQFFLSRSDFGWLLILGTVCTVFSFLLSVLLMKRLTPYTFAMAINLEPIYTMILAVVIWPESETMSPGFYFGAAIVLAVISLNSFVSNRVAKRAAKQSLERNG